MGSRHALILFFFVTFAAFGLFHPFLPSWLAGRGIHGFELGLIGATRPVMGIVAPIAFGVLADVLGLRGSLLRLASLGTVLAMTAIVALVWLDPTPAVVPLLLLMCMFSFFRAPMFTLADVAALETDGAYGRYRVWGSLAFLLSVFTCGYLVDAARPLAFPAAVALLLCVAVALAFALPKRTSAPPRPVYSAARALFSDPNFQLFLLSVFLWQASHAAYDLCISLHLDALGASQGFVGAFWAFGTLAEMVLMMRYTPWLERVGAFRLLLIGMGLTAVRWAVIALVPSPAVLFVFQPLHAASFALVFVAALEYVKQRAEPHVLATAQASFAAVTGIGGAVAMLIWGPLFKAYGGVLVFAAAALVALASAGVLATKLVRETRRAVA